MDKKRSSGETRLGIAVDLGTTTVAVKLFDMLSQEPLGEISRENKQRLHGQDVIQRIIFAEKSQENLKRLQQEAVESINLCIEALLCAEKKSISDVRQGIVVGNTTMIHLLFGQSPKSLAQAPFQWDFQPPKVCRGADLGLTVGKDAILYTLPNISGHIGSDTTAAMLYAGLHAKSGNYLLLDLGTNAEIVLKAGNKLWACSAAMGPAFEGGSIGCGMIAAQGAIERVWFDEKNTLQIHTVGEAIPKGICGSGLVDCIAALLQQGLMDSTGRLLINETRGFRLFPGKQFGKSDLYITQEDVRQVQLAKAAVRAGIHILFSQWGKSETELEKVYLAGAFGSYVSKESAAAIGLLPPVSLDKIEVLGNAAGQGAAEVLLNKELFYQGKAMAAEVLRIELAQHRDFQEIYMQELDF